VNKQSLHLVSSFLTFPPCSQTDSHAGRSKTKGKQAVQAVLELSESIGLQKAAIAKLEITLTQTVLFNMADISGQLRDAREHLARLERGFERKKSALGVGEQANLRNLQRDAFVRLRMNALALKQRLRDRLRQRKFEIEKLERSYRRSANGMYG
jgi:hypothetical protein